LDERESFGLDMVMEIMRMEMEAGEEKRKVGM
jgi:hypothetical protein